jgi:DNA-binding transcriptional LysR family regulator
MALHRLGLISTRLHYFQAVAQLGSIRRAAQSLNVAPSAISRTIHALEEELGAPLFERARQRLKLTSAGEILLYHARASIAELNRATAFIDDLQGLRRGSVAVAAVESVTRGLLPGVLAHFWERYPEVTVEVKTTGSRQAFELVLQGDCDLAIAFDVRVPKTAQRLAGASLRLGALVPPHNPLARRREVRLRDFANERVLLSDASLTLGASIDAALLDSALELHPRAITNSIDLMIDLAVRGQGVTCQTRVGVERELSRGELMFVPFGDPQLRPRKLSMIARSKVHLSAAPAALATLLIKAIQALDGK